MKQSPEHAAFDVGYLLLERHLLRFHAHKDNLIVRARGDEVARHGKRRRNEEDVQERKPDFRRGISEHPARKQKRIPLERIRSARYVAQTVHNGGREHPRAFVAHIVQHAAESGHIEDEHRAYRRDKQNEHEQELVFDQVHYHHNGDCEQVGNRVRQRDSDYDDRKRREVEPDGRARHDAEDDVYGQHHQQVDDHVVHEAVNGLGEKYLPAADGKTQQKLVVAAHIQVFHHVADGNHRRHAKREQRREHQEFKRQLRPSHEHRRQKVNARHEYGVDCKRKQHAERFARFVLGGHIHLGAEPGAHFQPHQRPDAEPGYLIVHCASSVSAEPDLSFAGADSSSSTGISGRISACSCAT